MSFCIRLRNLVVIGRTSADGNRVGNLLLGSGLVIAFVENGENIFAYQISIRYLNPLSI